LFKINLKRNTVLYDTRGQRSKKHVLFFIPLQNAVEFIEQIVRGLATNEPVEVHHFVREFRHFGQTLATLEVGLAVREQNNGVT